jgi:hypothetical protein
VLQRDILPALFPSIPPRLVELAVCNDMHSNMFEMSKREVGTVNTPNGTKMEMDTNIDHHIYINRVKCTISINYINAGRP